MLSGPYSGFESTMKGCAEEQCEAAWGSGAPTVSARASSKSGRAYCIAVRPDFALPLISQYCGRKPMEWLLLCPFDMLANLLAAAVA